MKRFAAVLVVLLLGACALWGHGRSPSEQAQEGRATARFELDKVP